jgi:hypothetical protein
MSDEVSITLSSHISWAKANGMITRDKKLVEPLAHAAFPEKDVFSSLKDVPVSYRRDWAKS